MGKLNCFTNDYDIVVAANLPEAIAVWEKQTGEDYSKDYAEASAGFEEMYHGEIICIGFESWETFPPLRLPAGAVIDYERHTIRAPAWAWAEQHGRGFLASTES